MVTLRAVFPSRTSWCLTFLPLSKRGAPAWRKCHAAALLLDAVAKRHTSSFETLHLMSYNFTVQMRSQLPVSADLAMANAE